MSEKLKKHFNHEEYPQREKLKRCENFNCRQAICHTF